jgi:hypothetical protein
MKLHEKRRAEQQKRQQKQIVTLFSTTRSLRHKQLKKTECKNINEGPDESHHVTLSFFW